MADEPGTDRRKVVALVLGVLLGQFCDDPSIPADVHTFCTVS